MRSTREKCHVKKDTEIDLQAKDVTDCWLSPEVKKRNETDCPQSAQKEPPCQPFDFALFTEVL
jgi:hypothetical protein